MSKVDPERHGKPGNPGEMTIPERQQSGNHPGHQSQLCDRGAGGNQPLGNQIKRIPDPFIFFLDGFLKCKPPELEVHISFSFYSLSLSYSNKLTGCSSIIQYI